LRRLFLRLIQRLCNGRAGSRNRSSPVSAREMLPADHLNHSPLLGCCQKKEYCEWFLFLWRPLAHFFDRFCFHWYAMFHYYRTTAESQKINGNNVLKYES